MTETAAETAAMTEAARHVDAAAELLAGVRGNVAQAVAATGAGYQSDAATLFRSTMDQWGGDFDKIIGGLEQIHKALTHNAIHYQATLESDRASVNQIAALLNGDANI